MRHVRPTFGEYLAQRLSNLGISQRELAEWTGINHSTISRIVADRRGTTLNTAICILTALGDDLGVLSRIEA